MAVSSIQRDACKAYMRVDDDTDDAVIESLMEAAAEYLGLDLSGSLDARQNLALWSLTLHYYDHRDSVGTETPFPIGLRPVINQLKADRDVAGAAEAVI